MPRYRLLVEYDGRSFAGWQHQDDLETVQGALETALAAVDGGPRRAFAAGRTDAGVHATGQVVHADLEKVWRPFKLREALNAHLARRPISVLEADGAAADFHARFSATGRTYLYRILDRRPPPALDAGRVWRVPVPLDADAMHAAAQGLVGQHDFSTFRDAQCQSDSPVKTLDVLDVRRAHTLFGSEVHVIAEARSFLHRQVRSMVGSLAEVGRGKWTHRDLAEALAAADRSRCGPVAPPDGLYLTGVRYGDPSNAADPRNQLVTPRD